MKIAIIGGGGVRTPLLVAGLTTSGLPVDEIHLFDIDSVRLAAIGAVASRMCARGRLVVGDALDRCLDGAAFVITSVRVGGVERRAADEATAQRHGIAGQETVGPAGFAMAARTIPVMVDYARAIAAAAPRAWIVNFTNPVGMVTDAMRTVTDRVLGICDTPTELFEAAAHALDLPPDACTFDYFGLNHLGWLREVHHDGVPQLRRLWDDEERLRRVYRVPLFAPESLRALRMLPTEYVFYYDQPARAFENVRAAGRSRGRIVAELTDRLFAALADAERDPVATYQAYLAARDAGYMQLEAGATAPLAARAWVPQLSGYDRIAVSVIRAIDGSSNAVIPLSVRNGGAISMLDDDDVVEVPCVVNGEGAWPVHVDAVPDSVGPLLQRVKAYERATVRAALARSIDDARAALALNPLVPNRAAADALIDDLQPLW